MSSDHETLRALGEVKGELRGIADLIRETNASTNRRLDDLKGSVDDRFKDHGQRIARLETNERNTAIRTAAIGAISGLTGTVVGQALANFFRIKGGG